MERQQQEAFPDEVFVQCAKCHLLICKTSVLEETPKSIEVRSVKAVKVTYQYSECLFLCENCSAVIGQVLNGRIILPKEAIKLSRIEYRHAATSRHPPYEISAKDRHLMCVQELMTFMERWKRCQTRCEDRLNALEKNFASLQECPLAAFLSTTDHLNS